MLTPTENVKLLLQKLKDVPHNERSARFRTVISFVSNEMNNGLRALLKGIIIDKPVVVVDLDTTQFSIFLC